MITAFVNLLKALAPHEQVDSKFLLNTLLNLENPAQKENAPFLDAVLKLRGRFNEFDMDNNKDVQLLMKRNALYKVVNEKGEPDYAISYNVYLYHSIIKECEINDIKVPSYYIVKFIYENQDKLISLNVLNDIYNSLYALKKDHVALSIVAGSWV